MLDIIQLFWSVDDKLWKYVMSAKENKAGNSLMAPKSQLASAHFKAVKPTRHKG